MARNEQRRLERIWKWFVRTRSAALRDALLLHYRPVLKGHAMRLRARLPALVELDDLISAGTFGLMKAIDAFDPSRGTKFETFCTLYIRGAMLDELRELDWVPRLVRQHEKTLTRAISQLHAETGRAPTDQELASRLQVSEQQLAHMRKDRAPVAQLSLTREAGPEQREPQVQIRDTRTADPRAHLDRMAVKEWVVQGLCREERLIVILYYYEQLTMKEIGATLGICESRVSQMHKEILERIKARFQHAPRENLTA